ncbi:MAG: hypothetical protein JSU04_12460 [Bdellovibrionales bacterium]|nr:hypothetical protein [Bdellovibrionales bacterium]
MMKSFLYLALSFLTEFSYAQVLHHSSHSSDRPSTHGMAVVGTQHIYLSHLPMFHSPHDYQVILEVTLDTASQAQYLKMKATTGSELITMVPETFVLPEMVAHPRPFKAAFYRGHFERGGSVFIDEASVTISKVIYFNKFSPTENKHTEARFILFGDKKEQFLAHQITVKPDFDQLLSVEAQGFQEKNNGDVLVFKDRNNDQALNPGEIETPDIKIQVKTNLYLEFGDLAI